MSKKDYEVIEHTADIGIRVQAYDLAGLFSKSAAAMFEIICEQITENRAQRTDKKKNITEKIKIKLKAQNLDELLVNWLSELLYLSSVKGMVFADVKINKLTETNLEAVAFGSDIANYKINTEIKAVTFHELEVKKADEGWQAKVIFDV